MGYVFSQRSRQRLQSCHRDLQLLMREALWSPDCPMDFTVLEGHRGEERQNELQAAGKSQLRYPNSKHNTFPSMAVDIAPWVNGTISWDWDHFNPLADHILDTWAMLVLDGRTSGEFKLTWGGTWRSFPDGPHFQLDPL